MQSQSTTTGKSQWGKASRCIQMLHASSVFLYVILVGFGGLLSATFVLRHRMVSGFGIKRKGRLQTRKVRGRSKR